MKICVIYGGISTEREVSINTAKQIISSIDTSKHEVVELLINKKDDILKIKDMNVDFAYIALHGKYGEDGKVQAVLEVLDIPYSGSNVLASAICMDKDITKRIVSTYGVRVAKWWTIRKGEKATYPENYSRLIVKPNSGGSSIGVNFITNQQELEKALEEIFKIDEEAIMEEIISGDEVSVPIISGKAYPIVKIEALKGKYFDYASKYEVGGAREYVVQLDEKLEKEIKEFTEKAYYATKCKGFARIDFLIQDNKAYMVEINTLPGMTAQSIFPRSLAYLGVDYKTTIELLIKESL